MWVVELGHYRFRALAIALTQQATLLAKGFTVGVCTLYQRSGFGELAVMCLCLPRRAGYASQESALA